MEYIDTIDESINDLTINNTQTTTITKETVITVISLTVFIIALVFGVLKIFDAGYVMSQAILIVIESLVGIVFSLLPLMLRKIFKVKLSFSIIIIIDLFMILAIIFGEVFQLYYLTQFWDSALHAFSGFGIAFAAYCLFDFLMKDASNLRHRFVISLFAAIAVSLAIGMIWEVLEFSIDSAFGTNMQKFMPKDARFFNGGLTHDIINGTEEEIAAFFRTPEGYKYALMDTMTDILYCLAGTAFFIILCAVTAKKYSSIYRGAITKCADKRGRALVFMPNIDDGEDALAEAAAEGILQTAEEP